MGTDKATGAAKKPAKADAARHGRMGEYAHRLSLHKQLRKTKFCMFHLQGACQFGKDCAFAHSVTEMSGTPDLRKTQLCKAFADGRCDDPQCNFAHGEVELRSTDMFFKRSLCIWNEKGKCRNDAQCRFAHGLEELRAYQNGQTTNDTGNATQPPPLPSKGAKRRMAKQKQKQAASTASTGSGSGSGSSSDNTRISSSNSPRSGSSSDNFSQQSSSEPMKVQPSSISPQKPIMGVPDISLLSQQFAQMQVQESLVNRLSALESALEAARWQQHMNSVTNSYNPDLQADIEDVRKSIAMLANQCNQLQERMMTAVKLPLPYGANRYEMSF